MKVSLKRITSSGKFIPEIDGLRFIAIFSVIIFHLYLFISNKDLHVYSDNIDYTFLTDIAKKGVLGVPLFFIISGFILGLPFANASINKTGAIKLKSYFARRLTRLEPPYILVMLLLFIGSVYVAKTMGFFAAIKSLLASLTYSHNFFYPGEYPFLNVSAWSLEVEVQFYLLAPILAFVFLIKNALKRRLLIVFAIFLLIIGNEFFHLGFISLYNYLHYFLLGFLLVDIYIGKKLLLPKTNYDYLLGICSFILIWLFRAKDFEDIYIRLLWEIIQISAIFIFYYYAIIQKSFKILRQPIITNLGGMCYSIYLLHYPLISMFGNVLLKYQFSTYSFINVGIYVTILLIIIISISSVFFLLIEKPCMNKNWFNNIFKKS